MPHLFVNRPRMHDMVARDAGLTDQFRWETINAVIYQTGGLLFIAGSILFFPALPGEADLGARIFILGSVLFLLVTGHDMAEVVTHQRARGRRRSLEDRLEFWAATAYIAGTLLFIAGSVFLQPEIDRLRDAAGCHAVGGLFFVLGATINALQVALETDRVTLQLMNITALTFVAGSLLFTVASVPYLWQFRDLPTRDAIDTFLASQYLIASVLFFLGGLFNYMRAYTVLRRARREHGVAETAAPSMAGGVQPAPQAAPALENVEP